MLSSTVLGYVLHDVLLTREEYTTMSHGMADSNAAATATTRVSDWLVENSSQLGMRYANELDRHFKR